MPSLTSNEELAARVDYGNQRLESRRVYNLAYYHAHKKPSQRGCCKTIRSSKTAL